MWYFWQHSLSCAMLLHCRLLETHTCSLRFISAVSHSQEEGLKPPLGMNCRSVTPSSIRSSSANQTINWWRKSDKISFLLSKRKNRTPALLTVTIQKSQSTHSALSFALCVVINADSLCVSSIILVFPSPFVSTPMIGTVNNLWHPESLYETD